MTLNEDGTDHTVGHVAALSLGHPFCAAMRLFTVREAPQLNRPSGTRGAAFT